MAKAEQLVSLTAAAREVGVSRQALAKYLKGNPHLNRGKAGKPLVSVREIKEFRARHLNPAKRNGDAARHAEDAAAPSPPPVSGSAPDPETAALAAQEIPGEIGDDISLGEARRIHEVQKARIAMLDYQRKSGETVPYSEALEVVNRSAGQLRNAWRTRARKLGATLAGMSDAREISRLLESEYDAALHELADVYER